MRHVITESETDPPTENTSEAVSDAISEAASVEAEPGDPGEAAATAAWLRMSAGLSHIAPLYAGRKDLAVRVAPGAGHGAPGCFVPALAEIELDAATLTDQGIDPATCHPKRATDRERYPALVGVLVHECAHARHSLWAAPRDVASSAAAAAARLLEESRIEAQQLSRRPGDRHWLRAASTTLILPDMIATEADKAEHAPAEPADDDDEPAAPVPAEPVPAEPVPSEPVPSEPVPAEPVPAEPVPAGTSEVADPEPSLPSLWSAAHAAGLILARVDAGVLDEAEAEAVASIVTPVLGEDRLRELRDIWRAAHEADDEDGQRMLDLGRAWCAVLDVAPEDADPADAALAVPSGITAGPTAEGAPGEPGAAPSALVAAITVTLAAIRDADRPEEDEAATARADRATARKAEAAARKAAERAAATVFADTERDGEGSAGAGGFTMGGPTSISGTRAPTEDEQAGARRLARSLRAAATRERVAVTTNSPTPPGRLRMSGALAADAQRAAGATPTAEPFTRTTRRHVPSPPLRIGIACDVSGSMYAVAKAIASTAWIVNRAVAHVPDAKAATVIYGAAVRAVTLPGRVPTEVREFAAIDGTEKFTRAVDALDAALDLTRRDAARLLVVVSDGEYTPQELVQGQQRITRLRASGCGVLWIGLDTMTRPMRDTRLLILSDPATAAEAIAKAASDTLRHA